MARTPLTFKEHTVPPMPQRTRLPHHKPNALLSLVAGVWPVGLTLTYLILLLQLVHQIEEHYGNRFRRFLNQHLAGGAKALTPRAKMRINVAEG